MYLSYKGFGQGLENLLLCTMERRASQNIYNIKTLYNGTSNVSELTRRTSFSDTATNKRLSQELNLSPKLFKLHIDPLACHWELKHSKGVKSSNTHLLSTHLYAEDQMLIQETE